MPKMGRGSRLKCIDDPFALRLPYACLEAAAQTAPAYGKQQLCMFGVYQNNVLVMIVTRTANQKRQHNALQTSLAHMQAVPSNDTGRQAGRQAVPLKAALGQSHSWPLAKRCVHSHLGAHVSTSAPVRRQTATVHVVCQFAIFLLNQLVMDVDSGFKEEQEPCEPCKPKQSPSRDGHVPLECTFL